MSVSHQFSHFDLSFPSNIGGFMAYSILEVGPDLGDMLFKASCIEAMRSGISGCWVVGSMDMVIVGGGGGDGGTRKVGKGDNGYSEVGEREGVSNRKWNGGGEDGGVKDEDRSRDTVRGAARSGW